VRVGGGGGEGQGGLGEERASQMEGRRVGGGGGEEKEGVEGCVTDPY
jgi:hypothetical protein